MSPATRIKMIRMMELVEKHEEFAQAIGVSGKIVDREAENARFERHEESFGEVNR